MQFIRDVAASEVLQQQIRALGASAELEAVADLGARIGLEFSVEELRAAFRADWAMRRFRYTAGAGVSARTP